MLWVPFKSKKNRYKKPFVKLGSYYYQKCSQCTVDNKEEGPKFEAVNVFNLVTLSQSVIEAAFNKLDLAIFFSLSLHLSNRQSCYVVKCS